MATNEERRIAIMAELARRAREQGAESKFYGKLTVAMAMLLQDAGMDAVELTGLYLATLHYAAMIAYGTIATPGDIHVRTGEDIGNQAAAHWDQACRDAEALLAKLRQAGKAPQELAAKVKLAPSDPKMRPDIAPSSAAVDKPDRPESLEDLLGRINAMGTGNN